MTTRQNAYYERTRDGDVSPLVQQAAAFAMAAVDEHDLPRTAIDCGCGSGRHIDYLRNQQFLMHGFDIEPDAIQWCRERFVDDPDVRLDVASFETYRYPPATLVMAFASLFFCPTAGFDEAWRRISDSVNTHGIFFGMFMGKRDEWAERETSFGKTLTFE
ncbi:MAG: class I SAM-dependent methyltransferase, partial [Pseudomonadota bacterium]